MKIPQIRIQSTPAQLEISTKRGELSIQQAPGDLQIEQLRATMNITRVPGKLTIDQTQARADVDLKSIGKRIEEATQLGKQDLFAGIVRRTQEGTELMKIENGFGAVASISKRNSEGPKKEFNIGYVPRAGSVKVSYDPGKVEIEIKPNKPLIQYNVNKPEISFEKGEVNISLGQRPSLKIDFE